jgi:hypothetical protein
MEAEEVLSISHIECNLAVLFLNLECNLATRLH